MMVDSSDLRNLAVGTLAREAIANPKDTILAALLIKVYGKAGVRFVARASWIQITGNLSMLGKTFKVAVDELAPATVRKIAPRTAIATTTTGIGILGGGVAIAALALGPEVAQTYYEEPSNYPTTKDGTIVPYPEFIYGAGTM